MKRPLFIFAGLISLLVFLAAGVGWVRSYYRLDEWSIVDDDGRMWTSVSFQGAVHLIRGTSETAVPRGLGWDAYDVPEDATWAQLHPSGTLAWHRCGVTLLHPITGPGPIASPFAPPAAAPAPVATATPASPTTRTIITKTHVLRIENGEVVSAEPTTAPAMQAAKVEDSVGSGIRSPKAPTPPRVRVVTPAVAAAAGRSPLPLLPWLGRADALIIRYWLLTLVVAVLPGLWIRGLFLCRLRRRRGLCVVCGYDLRASGERCPECGTPTGPIADGASGIS